MKRRPIEEMLRAKQHIERGTVPPAVVWELGLGDKGALRRKRIDRKRFQAAQRTAWDKSITSTRRKLGLSQSQFARVLGISVRTLHHWEQGSRTPTGAARVLLRVAAQYPKVVLKAAA